MTLVGVHLGISNFSTAIEDVKRLKCTAIQIFTHNPRSWNFKPIVESEINSFIKTLKNLGVKKIFSHGNYLLNPAGEEDIRKKTISSLKLEVLYAHKFKAEGVVVHVGKHKGAGTNTGVKRVIKTLNSVANVVKRFKIKILLENLAGQGSEMHDLNILRHIIKNSHPELRPFLRVCLDTCHLHAAGYNLDDVPKLVKDMPISLIHVNDALYEFGSHKDRHYHLGKGTIGNKKLKRFVSHFSSTPQIIETPFEPGFDDSRNLCVLKKYHGLKC